MDSAPLPPEIQAMREAMSRVRHIQAASSLAIELARHNAETEALNMQFLGDFLHMLPVKIVNNNFLVKNPVDLRATAAFGIRLEGFFSRDDGPGFVIGSRSGKRGKLPLTELLVAKVHQVEDDNEGTVDVASIATTTVHTRQWDAIRQAAVDRLMEPYPDEVYTKLLDPQQGGYVIARMYSDNNPAAIGMATAVKLEGCPTTARDGKIRRRMNVYYRPDEYRLGRFTGERRSLLSSDFHDYGVMTHLEYLAGAFEVGEAFDNLVAKRNAVMPAYPLDTAVAELNTQHGAHIAIGHAIASRELDIY